MNTRGRVILGMDPGTNLMGYGIVSVDGSRASLLAMGVIRLSKLDNHYVRLHRIYERVQGLVDAYHPQEVAIEAPFFGKNVQSMLKLGRAQGVAIAAAMSRGVPVTEYEPRKIKQAITGNGGASKEQVREMLRHMLHINPETLKDIELDATDALGAAMCHFYESQRPAAASGPKNWAAFIAANPDRVKR